MSPSRIRYVTACQQLLALGVVLAALAPAAGVMSLDVVREAPGTGRGMSIGTGTAVTSALEVTLTTPQGVPTGDVVPGASAAVRERRTTAGATPVELVSGAITLQPRTRAEGNGSARSELEYDAGHGPDPESDGVQVKVATSRGPLPGRPQPGRRRPE